MWGTEAEHGAGVEEKRWEWQAGRQGSREAGRKEMQESETAWFLGLFGGAGLEQGGGCPASSQTPAFVSNCDGLEVLRNSEQRGPEG